MIKLKTQKSKVLKLIPYRLSLITSQSGFTLIELLIVIALLGALAVGLIGAIDPFEQLKKGTDTGTRDIVNQLQTAVIRYYSVKNTMPWLVASEPDKTPLNAAPMVDAITNMVGAGELKSDFTTIQAGKLDKVFVTGSIANNTVVACYLPTSKSFKADPNTKFDQAGVPVADETQCVGHSANGATVCYWCIQ